MAAIALSPTVPKIQQKNKFLVQHELQDKNKLLDQLNETVKHHHLRKLLTKKTNRII